MKRLKVKILTVSTDMKLVIYIHHFSSIFIAGDLAERSKAPVSGTGLRAWVRIPQLSFLFCQRKAQSKAQSKAKHKAKQSKAKQSKAKQSNKPKPKKELIVIDTSYQVKRYRIPSF